MQRLSQLPFFGWVKRYRKPLAIVVIVASLAFLITYIILEPGVVTSILKTDPRVIFALLVLYLSVLGTQFVIMYATIRLCKKNLPLKNGIFLSVYSAVANFFGPLQSGPGVRAVYLKQKIGLRIRDYTAATLFYYFAFAAINGSLLFINSAPILTTIGLLLAIATTILGTKRFHFDSLSRFIIVIFFTTIIQILLMTTIFFVELNTVHGGSGYSLLQSLVYSASANLSLFVSITPGAIGIRETFIVFTQSLHHIPFNTIIAAGVLDRAFYIAFLIGLFAVSSSMHLKNMFGNKKSS